MGITISYRGKIDNTDDIDKLTDELTDISKELKWEYERIDDREQNVKGIIIKPHQKSEPLSILFNKDSELINWGELSFHEANSGEKHFAFIKTQYAPLEIHIAVIKLLKYLKSRYISNLEVFDEGDYWDTMDEKVLKDKMDFLASRIAMMGDILDAHKEDFSTAKNPEELIEKIESLLKKFGFRKKD